MSWRYRGGPGSGALADIGSHIIDLAEFLAGPISSVSGAVLTTAITERALPAGTAVGHAAAELSDVTEKVDNEDVVTLTARFASGASGTFTASTDHLGHPNALGFELSCENGAATFELERMGEFTLFDSTDSRNSGYRRVLVGPDHPYLTGGLPMDFPGVNYGQNDLFTIQARAFLEQVAGVENLPPCPDFAHGLHNLRILDAVVGVRGEGWCRGHPRRLRFGSPLRPSAADSTTTTTQQSESAMKLGVYNAVLHDRPLPEALQVIAGLGLDRYRDQHRRLPSRRACPDLRRDPDQRHRA